MKFASATSLVLMALLSCPGLADDDKSKAAQKDVKERLVEMIQDLNLTDEQEAKIADIQKQLRPKVQEAAKELETVVKEEMQKVQGVLTPAQKEKLETLKEERKTEALEGLSCRVAHLKELDLTDAELSKIDDIRKEFRPKIAKALEAFTGILTDDQKKARQEGLEAGKRRAEILKSLNLSDEQREKAQAAGKEVRAIVKEEMAKIGDVLTEEQKSKLVDLKSERPERVRDRRAHMVSNFQDLNLTDEQKTKISEIRQEFRPKVHEAGNKVRAAIREEMEMVLNVIKE
jgi:Spy/CpxP family protein refolding chaperone